MGIHPDFRLTGKEVDALYELIIILDHSSWMSSRDYDNVDTVLPVLDRIIECLQYKGALQSIPPEVRKYYNAALLTTPKRVIPIPKPKAKKGENERKTSR